MALSVKVGTYTGNGGTKAVTGVGFQPTVLFIKGGTNVTQVGTADMGSNKMQAITGETPATGRLNSYDSDGFTLGSDAKVNANAATYYYLALAGSGDIKTGTYAGDSTGPRSITGVGFQPNLVMWWDDLGDTGGFRSSDMPSTDSWIDFGTVGLLTDRVFTLDADGFTVSFRNEVNGTGRNYYYVALKNATNLSKVFTYAGNNTDDRTLTGVGFQPDFALTKGTTNVAALRFKDEVGDNSFLADATGEAANRIQSFTSDGMQVGTAANVNASSTTYYAFGFKESTTATTTSTSSSTSTSITTSSTSSSTSISSTSSSTSKSTSTSSTSSSISTSTSISSTSSSTSISTSSTSSSTSTSSTSSSTSRSTSTSSTSSSTSISTSSTSSSTSITTSSTSSSTSISTSTTVSFTTSTSSTSSSTSLSSTSSSTSTSFSTSSTSTSKSTSTSSTSSSTSITTSSTSSSTSVSTSSTSSSTSISISTSSTSISTSTSTSTSSTSQSTSTSLSTSSTSFSISTSSTSVSTTTTPFPSPQFWPRAMIRRRAR